MKKYLWLHAIVQFLAGTILYLYPSLLWWPGSLVKDAVPILKMYAFLSVIYSNITFLVIKHIEEPSDFLRHYVVTAIGFHMVISFMSFGLAKVAYFHNIGICTTHAIIFVILTFGYLKHRFDGNSKN